MNENVSNIQTNATCIPWTGANNPTQIRKCHFWIIYMDLNLLRNAIMNRSADLWPQLTQ